MTIVIDREYRDAGEWPVLHTYPQQCQPQGAYITVCSDGEVYADWNAEIGSAVPATVWHGVDMRFSIHPELTVADLDELFEELAPLLEELHKEHSVSHDGSNLVGRVTEEGQELSDQIERICIEWPPSEWEEEDA